MKNTKGIIHFAKLEKSPRLQRLLAFLQTGGEFSTRDIILNTGLVAINSAVAELRMNGISISCRVLKDREDGARVWAYRLEDQEEVAA